MTTDHDPKAAEVVDEAARLLDPAIKPHEPVNLEKVSLADMSFWLMDLRLKLRFRGGIYEGRDADFALLDLTPADAAMLERIADSLNYLDRERQTEKAAKDRAKSGGWGRR